ncbi:MAG: polymer-forming cytoskeletal family protein [Burkholderiaceae bacterium]|nr:polymer-forming cytoskeletal family protein [Burkholderiaceae bacterium]
MFSRKPKNSIDTLIGATTRINGDVFFTGGMRIDGEVKGNVIADEGQCSLLVISEKAKIDGEVKVAHLVTNGEINGTVYSTELLEMQPKARINGDVNYKQLEMHAGALISGHLSHESQNEPVLQLAMAKA